MTDNIGSFFDEITKKSNTEPKIKVFSSSTLTNKTKIKLFSYQLNHVVRLVNILLQYSFALDCSDTGVGKTYAAAAVCKELGLSPIIVCPKTLIFNWNLVLEYFGVEAYDIVNYETLRNGKTYTTNKYKSRKKSPYLDIIDPDPDDPLKSIYKWKLPKNAILIFDESHRCKGPSTDNGKLLISTKEAIRKKIPVLVLSATICEHFSDMKIPFYLMGLIPNTRNFNHYIKTLKLKYPTHKVKKSNYDKKSEYKIAMDNAQAMIIYEEIKEFTARIKIKDLGDKFPSNQICAHQFIAEESGKIAEAYEQIAEHMQALKDNPGQNHLAQIQKLKQEIELRKVPIFIEQSQLYLDEGKSVIIFVNYLKTLHIISDHLDIKCKIYGDQTMQERLDCINLFQSNQERIIICQARAGSVGISLHDLNGNYPRVTLINYPDSAADLLQELGRAPRSGAKSSVLQRIIFVANVDYEKKIMQNINRKLVNISAINDGDLEGYKYKVKKITRKKINTDKLTKNKIIEVDHLDNPEINLDDDLDLINQMK